MNYDPKSSHAEEFIHHGEIEETLAYGEANRTNRELIDEILAKARERRGLTHREAMVLLDCGLEDKNQEIYELAEQIKKERDDILAKAEAYANKTMDAAEENARALMSETEVLRKASEAAEAMRAEAEENYRKMDYQARSLAFNILDSAEKTIKEGLNTIADRKRKLIEE